MTKNVISLELQVGFEPTPCRLRVGCSTTEATAACCRSFPAVRETSKVCVFYIGEKRNQCVYGAKRVPCPPLRSPFGHYQYSTHFRKNRPVFFPTSRYVSTSPYSASVKRRNAFSFRRYTSDFSTCSSSQSRSACPLRLFT